MDAKDAIREFLVSWHERISPDDAGLPVYGRTGTADDAAAGYAAMDSREAPTVMLTP